MDLDTTLVELFSGSDEIEAVPRGAVIFVEGDTAAEMFVLLQGEVEIVAQGRVLQTLAAGSLFGEMALIDAQPRSAGCRAASDCRLLRISAKQFNFLVQHAPAFALLTLRSVSARLRGMLDRES
ncbi:MAG TPA: cyclic nucleotide-binding domain-containing protein, partial [Solimonas sp.]|nr:cyclic nucleotide-binding domain-containing protein [Solimonas sp.]